MNKLVQRRPLYFLLSLLWLTACATIGGAQISPTAGQNRLHIPALIDSQTTPEIELVLQHGAHQFYEGIASETMGINGDYLGPTIRLHRGTEANITFVNEIDEPTTVHGHGLHIAGAIDGGPQGAIAAGERWRITIPVIQEAGTSWYHPHFMGTTAHHVHAGLAGIYLIEDQNSQALDLPKTYGVDDIPLIVQDRSFTDGKMNPYAIADEELEDGLREDTLVVNGTVDAYHTVPQGWVRLRLLNASNARSYRFSFAGGLPFFKIATEGGFLNRPIELTTIDMAPGERNEIMIDLSAGQDVSLRAGFIAADPEDDLLASWFGRMPTEEVVALRVDPSLPTNGNLPSTLNDIVYFDRDDATRTRTFSLDMDDNGNGSQRFSINGRSMNMGTINEVVKQGEIELWRVTGEFMPHPFHMHGVSFQILTHNGEPPAEADRGWKDTVVVTGEVTELLLRFDHLASEETPYMFHCHILEHEDAGMMGQFTVVE